MAEGAAHAGRRTRPRRPAGNGRAPSSPGRPRAPASGRARRLDTAPDPRQRPGPRHRGVCPGRGRPAPVTPPSAGRASAMCESRWSPERAHAPAPRPDAVPARSPNGTPPPDGCAGLPRSATGGLRAHRGDAPRAAGPVRRRPVPPRRPVNGPSGGRRSCRGLLGRGAGQSARAKGASPRGYGEQPAAVRSVHRDDRPRLGRAAAGPGSSVAGRAQSRQKQTEQGADRGGPPAGLCGVQ